uniref:Signal recognition particle 54 kDa protein 2 n=1 Tax=Tanacetum cinerariifolium TaxID=118510 RepID=A0A6L2NRU2_TANCI|nr:signal recognition particle 54 kDa protein 2 [Tanacetum cinerariifolium]
MDSSIGQAQAFRQSVDVGAPAFLTTVVIAATKSPVIFIGTGEHMDEFEAFDVKSFVSRLLGMGDLSGFMDKIHEVVPMEQPPELLQKLSEGNFTMRIMYEQFQNILKMGPINQMQSLHFLAGGLCLQNKQNPYFPRILRMIILGVEKWAEQLVSMVKLISKEMQNLHNT